jgi:hypothetical protein
MLCCLPDAYNLKSLPKCRMFRVFSCSTVHLVCSTLAACTIFELTRNITVVVRYFL